MDETQLREHLRAALDEATPPADLYERALLELPSSRERKPRRALIGVTALVVIALVVALMVSAYNPHNRVRVFETPTSIDADLAATTSIEPIMDFVEKHDVGGTYQIAVENRVARCMRSRSWVYVPRVANLVNVYGAGDGPTDPNALLQYRERYGYGYLNATPGHPEQQAAIDELNQRYFATLDPEAQLRYTRDLGTGPDERDFPAPTSAPDSGCRGTAEVAERTVIPRVAPAVVQELFRRQNEIAQDPTFLAAQREWASCMARAGFQFAHAGDAQGSISNLFAPPPDDPGSQASDQAQANAETQKEAAALERRTGTADARCSAPTTWPVQRRLELAILQDVINHYGRDVVCGATCAVEPGTLPG
jgi:hypothetical protein